MMQAASAVIDEARRGAGCGDPCPDCAERYTDAHWLAAHAPEALLPGGERRETTTIEEVAATISRQSPRYGSLFVHNNAPLPSATGNLHASIPSPPPEVPIPSPRMQPIYWRG